MFNLHERIFTKIGGFMKGICHPCGNCKMLTDAGLTWVRRDAPYPFDENGNISESHRNFLNETRIYAENGLRSVIISPYPRTFIAHGIDASAPEGLKKVSEVCEFMAREYAAYGVCWQATNEMFVIPFRAPLNEVQSKNFVIASLKGLKKGDPNAAVGHNSVGGGKWDEYCVEINGACECDYLGYDLYNGSWSSGDTDTYTARAKRLYELVKIPIILMEFGFSSFGRNVDRDDVTRYLNGLGFADMNDILSRPQDFIGTLPPRLRHSAETCSREDLNTAITGMMPHLLKGWFSEKLFPHNEEGQAEFYAELLPKLVDCPYLAGAVIYCWQDSHTCFSCGAPDCPCETAWGMIRRDGTPKKAYSVMKEVFNRI